MGKLLTIHLKRRKTDPIFIARVYTIALQILYASTDLGEVGSSMQVF